MIVVLLLLSVASSAPAQEVRIASLRMNGSGPAAGSYIDIARAVGRFDVVAADGIRDPGDMEKVLGGVGDGWEAILSRRGGFFGFFFDERVEVVKELGTWRGPGRLARAPYGVRFRLSGTRFAFTIVACRVTSAEVPHLPDVSRFFEDLTGNRGTTILAVQVDGGRPEEARITASTALRMRLGPTALDRAPPRAVFLSLRTSPGAG
jgi:hypothetical protein